MAGRERNKLMKQFDITDFLFSRKEKNPVFKVPAWTNSTLSGHLNPGALRLLLWEHPSVGLSRFGWKEPQCSRG